MLCHLYLSMKFDESVEKMKLMTKMIDDFDFNPYNSIEFDEGYRSPVGIGRKSKILKWKNKKITKILDIKNIDGYIINKMTNFLENTFQILKTD